MLQSVHQCISGKNMTVHSEDQLKTSMTQSWEAAMAARDLLVEEVAGFDDELAEKVMVVP